MNRQIAIIVLMLGVALTATARVRTTAEKRDLAAKALHEGGVAQARGQGAAALKELRTLSECSLVGYEDGAFAVVANDDARAGVLGVATAPTRGDNPGFEWWLQAVNDALQQEPAAGTARRAPGPDVKKYPPAVGPLVTSHWGQGDPFYRLCPTHPQDVFCATGCVATAMAQILYSHKQPAHGFGSHSIYYPYKDPTGQRVEANFGETLYDWDNMIDDYANTDFTEEQASAVATLMLHCAVAADMQFGGYNHGGSGTTENVAAEGLKYYFGFDNARHVSRSDFSDDEWMDMVYGELSSGNAVVYGGQNLYGNGGHAFVVHGYREDGFVLVNWGWNGDAEGYFDIEKLNPSGYHFSVRQDMILGISGGKADLESFDLSLASAGSLSTLLVADAIDVCGTLKVTGPINGTDLKTIRALAGRDAEGNPTGGNLAVLDLSEAEIVAGGEPYLVENGQQYVTADGELPYKAFYDCRKLTTIRLPRNLHTLGDGALGGCYLLQSVEWPDTELTSRREGDALYTSDMTRLLAVLPTATGTFSVPETVTSINRLAFAGCVGLNKVSLPASVTEIGGEAFRNCFSLTEIRLHGKQQPTLSGYNTFDGIRTDVCQLKIPSGMTLSDYTNKGQWRDFGDNIVMYGTTLTARDLDKDYGDENPNFGYRISGDNVDGEPSFTTPATVFSLPGDYPIHISAGTVTDPDVELVDGVLTIYPAILTVTPVDESRRPDEVELPYRLKFSGFVNGEDESILQELPTVTADALNGAAEGTYTLSVSGGRSDRYEFKYRKGTLTVDANAPTGIGTTRVDAGQGSVYTLGGQRAGKTPGKGVYVEKRRKRITK